MKKLRVLFASEASYTLSGYGIYYKEIISRLHATGKYEIAEFASFGYVNDERDSFVKWHFYPNAVVAQDPRHGNPDNPAPGTYTSHPENNFGAWRFERVLIDFQPDVVIDVRDPWMFMYQNRSQLRRYFHWVIMPTVDSIPQQEEWLDHFTQADAVFTYSDWGLEALKQQGGGLIKLQRSAPPGVHLEEFYPKVNKFEHKRIMGFDPKLNIVGTVMRNQKRKLFPDLLQAFGLFLQKCHDAGKHDLAANTYLYFHTSYPDTLGCWNIPRIIKEEGLSHKILFTYVCKECKAVFASCFQDARTVCPRCRHIAAILPAVGSGLSTEQLNDVYNLFDVYVQYATCEGFGMPQVEAAAAGVPVMSTDYSAMTDVVRKLNGFPIKVARMYRAVEEDANKAYPSNEDLAQKLFQFLSLPMADRQKKGAQARAGVEKHYVWDKTAKIWESYLDNVKLTGTQGKWDSPQIPPFQSQGMDACPPNLTHDQFVEWAIIAVLGDASYLNTVMAMDMVRALNYELMLSVNHPPRPYSRQNVWDKLNSMAQARNAYEHARCNPQLLPPEDYVQYAHMKGSQR
jgi:glycosyltransferase involved in cell wall biosynthesis